MRPVHLVLQAFGPFAGREEVDFREAVASGLFGVYGPTGSGKSTLFSAIAFALFGEAAKPEQDIASLRSDHADPALLTEVEFIFDIGDRRYVILRRPEQPRAKQRGGGTTTDAHEAFLFDATGLSPESVLAGNRGKVIAEKKVGVVRDAVTELLGYGPEQFRQIVLLPQGKFEAFLASKTEKRLDILRELFDVSVYRAISARFREDAAMAERQVKAEREVCARRFVAEGFSGPEALAEGISQAEATHQAEAAAETAAAQRLETSRGALASARQLASQFQAAETARAALDTLRARSDEIAAIEARVANARRAQALADVELHRLSARADAARAEAQVAQAAHLAATAAEASQAAAAAHAHQLEKDPEADRLRQAAEALDSHLRTLEDAAGHTAAARHSAESLLGAQRTWDDAEGQVATLTATRRTEDQSLRQAQERDATHARITARHAALELELRAAERHESAHAAVAEARVRFNACIGDHARVKDAAGAAASAFDAAERALSAAQSLHLAARLVPGTACPVCGSPDHPAPATGQVGHAGLDRQFREAKETAELAQAELQVAARSLAGAESLWRERAARLAELPAPERSSAELRAPLQEAQRQIAALAPPVSQPQVEDRLRALDAQIAQAETAREAARAALDAARQGEALARDRLERALATIPSDLRSRPALEAAIAANRAARQALHAARDASESEARRAREAALAAARDHEAAIRAHGEATQRLTRAAAVFDTRLAESGLSEPEYQASKARIPHIPADTAVLSEHARALAVAEENDAALHRAIAGQTRPDPAPLEAAVALAVAELDQAAGRRHKAAARTDRLSSLRREIEETLRALDRMEEESAPLRGLAALFNADNPHRLDLETFAIGAMFDQVLAAANQRLAPMTAGRYTLERETEGGGRARRGLGIRVLDIHTGKARAPATLSGGETFIAALALALGLSDIVESVSGRVRLDTIFIDEGFGTLDTENDSGTLDQVLQVLTGLVGQSRTVGLISHVPMVQEAVPNGFYIRKDVHGSHVERRDLL